MIVIASIAVVAGVVCLGWGVLNFWASMMSDAPTENDKSGCIAPVVGLVLIGTAVGIAWL